MTEDEANAIYDVLILHAGASPDGDARTSFVYSHTHEPPPREYRFMGSLGFGGKFWSLGRDWYVTCYPEDSNADRDALVLETNKALAELRERMRP